MKKTIRNNSFETNSSSEHSLTLYREDDVRSLILEIETILDELDDVAELYSALGKIEHLKEILVEEINKIKEEY